MVNQNLLEILTCPGCGGKGLSLNDGGDLLRCKNCSQNYPVSKGVPVMLAANAGQRAEASEIHKEQGTTFKYIDHYQKDAEHFDYFQTHYGATGHNERRLREYIISKIPKTKCTILDVGCGSAWVARALCPKGYSVLSMDISLKNTSEALKKYPSENHAAIVADAYALPLADNSIDFIIASEIIEHTASPERFIKSLFRVLKPNGEIIVTTPYKEKLIYSLCIHCNKQTPHNAHLHSFDENKLASLYQGNDLESYSYFTFGNKALIYLRTHILLRHFPFRCWKLTDKLFNAIYKAPTTILVKWKKKG